MRSMKGTGSALVTSMIALLLCISMLLGTTYAWFTDTASSGVQVIQAGKLDVELQKKVNGDWVSAEGGTLTWERCPGDATVGEIIWEPGCSYQLPELRVVNKGDLAVKYKLFVKGITKDSSSNDPDLREILEWTVAINGTVASNPTNLEECTLLPRTSESVEYNSDTYNISVKFPDVIPISLSGRNLNDYKGKSVNDISITVLATQLDNESDSFDNTYDKDALYCALATPVNRTRSIKVAENSGGNIAGANGETITLGTTAPVKNKAYTLPTTQNGYQNQSLTIENGTLEEKITTTGGSDYVIYDISYSFTSNTEPSETVAVHGFSSGISHKFQLSKGLENLVVTHNGKTTAEEQAAYGRTSFSFTYNPTTGVLIISSTSFSRFKVSFDSDFEASTDGQGYITLEAAMDAAAEGGTVTLLKDLKKDAIYVKKSLNFNLGSHTVDCSGSVAFDVAPDKTCSIANGTIKSKELAIQNNRVVINEVAHTGIISGLKDLTITGGIKNSGTITTMDGVTLTATGNTGIFNVTSDASIGTIQNTTIVSETGIQNNGIITTLQGMNIIADNIAIVNNGTIESIQAIEETEPVTATRTTIAAKQYGIVNHKKISTISGTDIQKMPDGTTVTTGIYNTSNNSIDTISDVNITASTAISNAGTIKTMKDFSIIAEKNFGINNDTGAIIESINNATIVAKIHGIFNKGQIGVDTDQSSPITNTIIKYILYLEGDLSTVRNGYGIYNDSGIITVQPGEADITFQGWKNEIYYPPISPTGESEALTSE